MEETKHIQIKDFNYELPEERIAKFPLPERLPYYVFESDRERELVFPHRCTYDGEIRPSAETDGGRFWSTTEIHEAMGKGIFTPNFESEYKKLFGNEPDMLL